MRVKVTERTAKASNGPEIESHASPVSRTFNSGLNKGKGRAYSTTRLPLDILFLIFVECDVQSLLDCRLVCKQFDNFIKSQNRLLYKLALALELQVDSPTLYWNPSVSTDMALLPRDDSSPYSVAESSLTSHQKLERLRRQTKAWRGEAEPAIRVSLVVTRNDSIYELNGGVFALGAEAGAWADANISYEGTRLDFVRLPSIIKDRPEAEWGYIKIPDDLEIVDFTMDVEMDLLVLIELKTVNGLPSHNYCLHLLSLLRSVNNLEPHPLALSPKLEYPRHPDWMDYQLVVGLYGDHIALLLGSGDLEYDRLVVWDWKKGGMASFHTSSEYRESFDTFIIFEEGLLLVPSLVSQSIDVMEYTLCDPSKVPPSIDPISNPRIGTFKILVSFLMPGVQAGLGYHYILVRSQPTGAPLSREREKGESSNTEKDKNSIDSTLNPFNPAPTPFAPSIDNSIVVISSRVGHITNPEDHDHTPIKDSDGTIIVTRKNIRRWIDGAKWKEKVDLKEELLRIEAHFDCTCRNWIPCSPPPEPLLPNLNSSPPPPPQSPIHRSTGVQTVAEEERSDPAADPGSRVMNRLQVPWATWMGETRWLRDLGSPRWVRDVCGTRLATRVKDRQPGIVLSSRAYESPEDDVEGGDLFTPADSGSSDDAILGFVPPSIPSQVHGDVPIIPFGNGSTAMQSLASYLSSHPSSSSSAHDTLQNSMALPPIPTSLMTALAQVPVPEEDESPDHEDVPPTVPLAPPHMPYRTRIFEFNMLPYHRKSGTIPYLNDASDNSRALGGKQSGSGVAFTKSNIDVGPDWIRRPITDETVIKAGRTYSEDIRTGLPFLEITSVHSNDCVALMMDAERIISMRTDEDGVLKSLEVTVM